MLELPQVPNTVNHAMMRVENGIIRRVSNQPHISPDPTVDKVVRIILQAIGELKKVRDLEQTGEHIWRW
jgi:hypothetical protein